MNKAGEVLTKELLNRVKLLKDVQIMSAVHSLSALGNLNHSKFSEMRKEVVRRGTQLDFSHKRFPEKQSKEVHHPFQILLDTPDYMVLNKPKGVVVSLDGDLDQDTVRRASSQGSSPELQEIISSAYGPYYPIAADKSYAHGIMHRLDRNTTGALLVAKTYAAFYDFRLQFSANTVQKEYKCIVEGVVLPVSEEWTSIKSRLRTSKTFVDGEVKQKSKVVESPDGTFAHTEFRCTQHLPNASLVEVKLHTGRPHQIRAHLASIGHPLKNDCMYGAKKSNSESDMSFFLHASSISFLDPDFERVTISIDPPFEKLLGKTS